MSNLYKCPICGGPTNYPSINYQPQPCLHCSATLKLKPAEHGENQQAERIVQLEEALRSIANGDILHSREKAKMALEGTFPPVDEKPQQEAQSHGNVKDPFYFKGYWYQEYLEMREKYWERTHENSQRADRIRELEEQWKVMEFLVNEGTKELETEQAKSRELYAMLGHIVDWSPELPFYMKDEYKTLFRNALAAARELLSKCRVKGGK